MTPSNRMPRQRRAIAPALDDPVRIVPLHAPREVFAPAAGIAAPPSPQLTYRGGPVLGAVQVFPVFWGAAWNDAPQLSTAQSLNRFLQVVVASPYVDQLAEYGTDRQAIGRGRYVGTATVPDSLGTNVTDSAIRHMLQQQLASGSGVPAPTPDTLYFVFLPPGVSVVAGGDRSCQAFCGYHDHIEAQLFYAVVPYPNCAGCLGELGTLDALTSVCSHELAEAITDPIPPPGLVRRRPRGDRRHLRVAEQAARQLRGPVAVVEPGERMRVKGRGALYSAADASPRPADDPRHRRHRRARQGAGAEPGRARCDRAAPRPQPGPAGARGPRDPPGYAQRPAARLPSRLRVARAGARSRPRNRARPAAARQIGRAHV